MTVINQYQWDLNYSKPAVLIDIILFRANQCADVIRLDAVAFLWKKIGTTCQNEQEAHLILQLLKDCCQVTAPGVMFIACNATYMALLWDAVATRNTRLLNQGIRSLPDKLDRATWVNYVRCHDDIGLGFDNTDIGAAGYEPFAHGRFLVEYVTGNFSGSPAPGQPLGRNEKTGDVRISGSLASLVGLEAALKSGDAHHEHFSIDLILLLHGLIMSFGGIPLIYYAEAVRIVNDYRYLENPSRARDNRCMHRPTYKGEKSSGGACGSVVQRMFDDIQLLIGVRKTPAA